VIQKEEYDKLLFSERLNFITYQDYAVIKRRKELEIELQKKREEEEEEEDRKRRREEERKWEVDPIGMGLLYDINTPDTISTSYDPPDSSSSDTSVDYGGGSSEGGGASGDY